ncbi:hypothetical protein KP509_34G035100 [Ceratopteris richardii]|uniref:Protein kinase domain-containing protein n=1 Tax=Ceratopteris richardii TaxID=49495 RepID=A0A8T2QKR2_CERRI|nr:hypothetical protein KP509_34G035100 [Ceratopteris richardii]
MGCFTVPHHRRSKCRQVPAFPDLDFPNCSLDDVKQRSLFPSSSPLRSRSRINTDYGTHSLSSSSPFHSAPLENTTDSSPFRKYASYNGRFENLGDATGIGRSFTYGQGANNFVASHSSPASFPPESDEGGHIHLFPLPLPPSVSASTTTSSTTCADDASLPSISSTGSGSLLSAPSLSTSSCCVSSVSSTNSKSCNSSPGLSSTADSHPSPLPLPPPPGSSRGLCEFSYDELAGACMNFAPEFFIREGGAGPVYRACLQKHENGSMDLAVTRLIRGPSHSVKKWRSELGSIAWLSHPHLCKVIGFSGEDPPGPQERLQGFERERLLVYEHMSNGNLEDLLYCRKGKAPLGWGTRVKIALGAAQGLSYLHERTPRQIIYRTFRTINIQVDSKFNAKLSDYGFAFNSSECPSSSLDSSENLYDAYAAPETRSLGEFSAKSNVWSFGIVLLELLTGRQNMDDFFPPEERDLLQWCRPYLLDSKRLYLVMDPEMKGRYPTREAKMLADLALLCLAEDSMARPTMRNVSGSISRLVEANACQASMRPGPYKGTVSRLKSVHSRNSLQLKQGLENARANHGANTYSGKYTDKFKISRSSSLASVLASPSRAFVGAGIGAEESIAPQRPKMRSFLSGEIGKKSHSSRTGDYPPLPGPNRYLSGDSFLGDNKNANSSRSGRKFKFSKSSSLVSVLASPARVFSGASIGGGDIMDRHVHGPKGKLRGLFSGEFGKGTSSAWETNHSVSGACGFLSGDLAVQDKAVVTENPLYQDSQVPPPLGRSLSNSSRLTPVTG